MAKRLDPRHYPDYTQKKVVDDAMQLHGGAGLSQDTMLTGFFAQARALRAKGLIVVQTQAFGVGERTVYSYLETTKE